MKNLFTFCRLIRWQNIFLVGFALVLGIFISKSNNLNDIVLIFLAISATLASANIVNNIFDSKIDLPGKNPIKDGKITSKKSLYIVIVLFIVSLFSGFFISLWHFCAVIIVSCFLFIYNFKLKRVYFIGNLIIALISGFMFVFIGKALGEIKVHIILALFAFLSHLIREIIKDYEDRHEDNNNGSNTIAIKTPTAGRYIILALFVVFNILVYVIFFKFFFGLQVSILFSSILLIISVLAALFFLKERYKLSQNIMKLIMLVGMIFILLGVI